MRSLVYVRILLVAAAFTVAVPSVSLVGAPLPTITRPTDQKNPTNGEPVRLSAVFSEPVTGFAAEDVVLSRDATVSVHEKTPHDGTTFEIEIHAISGDGPLCASIPAGAAAGLDGSPCLASTGADPCVVVDRTPPPPPDLLEPADGTAASDLSPRFAWTPPDDATGIAKYEVEIRGPKTRDYVTSRTTYTPTLGQQGTYTWRVNCLDGAGNAGEWTARRTLVLDIDPPSAPAVNSSFPRIGIWARAKAIDVSITPAADLVSGIEGYAVVWDHSGSTTPSDDANRGALWAGEAFTPPEDGEWWFHAAALDRAGNVGAPCHAGPFCIDRTPPTLRGVTNSLSLPNDPGRLGATADWSAITAIDALDPHPTLEFSIPAGSLLPLGRSSVVVTAEDRVGNTLARSISVNVSNTEPPVVEITWPGERDQVLLGETREPAWNVKSLAPIQVVRMKGVVSGRLDTRVPGRHEFSVTVTDSTGLSGTASAKYIVLYGNLHLEIVRVRPDATEEVVWPLVSASAEADPPALRLSEWIRVRCQPDEPFESGREARPITFSLVRADPASADVPIIEKLGVLRDNGDQYAVDIPLAAWRPGAYTLWIGFVDGSSESFSFRLVR